MNTLLKSKFRLPVMKIFINFFIFIFYFFYSLLYYVDCALNNRNVKININEDELCDEAREALELMSELYTFEVG